MIKRVVAVGVLIFALMLVIKDGRVLRDAGLTGRCSPALTFADGTQLEGCRAGKLVGKPDLSGQGCRDAGARGAIEYWRCPAAVASGPRGG
jgi:hypothetical protein